MDHKIDIKAKSIKFQKKTGDVCDLGIGKDYLGRTKKLP